MFLFLYKLCVFKYFLDNPPHVCSFFFTSCVCLDISLTIPRMCVPFSLQATIGRILRRITFVAPASGGKCICIESTGAPLRFIENNCGNHSWKKEIGVFYQKSSWRLRCCKKQYKDEKNSNIFSAKFHNVDHVNL